MKVRDLIQALQEEAEKRPDFLDKDVTAQAEEVDATATVNGFAEAGTFIYLTTDCPEHDDDGWDDDFEYEDSNN
ncbi:hypothetical protein [Pantoea sp. X85]|uniref:hypothetical protein n=1 Tax=Pantoea sp. X85 TaxID=3037258 RepID=UPI0024132F9A|nr:hypothetical protein [Pantoea sp. X85]WFL66407.1 hypothetical protein P6287_13625 [Pantoea sp. X85]